MNNNITNYIELNKDKFIKELFDLLKIPSVSTNIAHKNDILKAAALLKEKLEEAGADYTKIMDTNGYPIVYAEKIIDNELPTILIYGHYDVQPPDPLNLWHNPPFEPIIKNNRIYARGASDDKGQIFIHVKALELMNKLGILPCNVKFIIEGEEEVGSKNLEDFIVNNKNLLKSDIVLISDTAMISNDLPTITTGLRGLSYVEVEVKGPNRDLHSGVYGGAVANPIFVLSKMIASLIDEEGKITIPGFYDDVVELNQEERNAFKKIPFNLEQYKKEIGIKEIFGEKDYSVLEKVSIRPSLDINGIWGGYTGEGAKTILPSSAYAKISMRLVPNQKSEKISLLFKNYFESIAPETVKVKVKILHGGEATVMPVNHIGFKAAEKAIESTYGKKPIPLRTGGTIPVVALFEKILNLKSVLLGFGLDEDAIHSPNESFGLFNYFKGIETITHFFLNYTKLFKEQSKSKMYSN